MSGAWRELSGSMCEGEMEGTYIAQRWPQGHPGLEKRWTQKGSNLAKWE